ncbi:chaperone TorD involved in molybdoenzyme TorA maturation [Desulfacinum infernum DSM 9756]|uniref:Chaperone TorD involved in molybdoenzyme TorA maturation n=1 Tax=Desulfacinum infernum DSM 9756 TaxID=1121391 RepID=A0A1M5IQD1_9BACT|nr:molecular chaperone TorD family protein [Desulfacinum infernum]SHG30436.1 chaperone TorD involved in molybdoenzyme TorA maturation [Desulfacinum infernum DSM 9756]
MDGVWTERMEMDRARAEVYGFFSRVFVGRPDGAFWEQLTAEDTMDALGALFGDHPALDVLRSAAGEGAGKSGNPEAIQVEYDNLFLVPGPYHVPPYESVLMADEKAGGRRATLFGKGAQEIARIYEAHGLEPWEGIENFPDHIGVELAFMEHLCRRAAESYASGVPDRARDLEEAAARFLGEHLHAFSHRLASAILETGLSPTYEALAQLLTSFLDDDLNQWASTAGPPEDGARACCG